MGIRKPRVGKLALLKSQTAVLSSPASLSPIRILENFHFAWPTTLFIFADFHFREKRNFLLASLGSARSLSVIPPRNTEIAKVLKQNNELNGHRNKMAG